MSYEVFCKVIKRHSEPKLTEKVYDNYSSRTQAQAVANSLNSNPDFKEYFIVRETKK